MTISSSSDTLIRIYEYDGQQFVSEETYNSSIVNFASYSPYYATTAISTDTSFAIIEEDQDVRDFNLSQTFFHDFNDYYMGVLTAHDGYLNIFSFCDPEKYDYFDIFEKKCVECTF